MLLIVWEKCHIIFIRLVYVSFWGNNCDDQVLFFFFRDEELNGKANLREIGPDGFHWL